MKSVFLLMLFSLLNYAASQSDIIDVDKLIVEGFLKPSSDSTPNTDNKNSGIDLTSIGGTDSCKCVPYYLCNTKITMISGVIDIVRVDDDPVGACDDYLSVCCNKLDLIAPPKLNKSKGCGNRNPEGIDYRITDDDKEAKFGEFPWMVAVFREEAVEENPQKSLVYQCGAALIHPSVVLTAAHCVTGKDKRYKIRAGEWDTQTKRELLAHQDRSVKIVINHPHYYADTLFNDVAILILESPLEIAENVDVICLPKQNMVIDEARCFASGWGKKEKSQPILKKIDLPIVPRNTCQDRLRTTRLGKHFELHSSFICAGGEPDKDTCKGDEGSALVCPIPGQPGRYLQAGIVAWGIGCGENQIPQVYANAAQFTDWIDEQLAFNNFSVSYYKY